MKLSPYTSMHKGVSIGLFPFLTTLVLLSVHYFTGALDWPEAGNIRAQRDFNSAVGMSILSGYFWLCLQLNHKNVTSTLISILVKTNQLSHLNQHRAILTTKLHVNSVNCLIVALFIAMLYVFIEGLLIPKMMLHQYLIAFSAVLFWFLLLLCLVQLSSYVNYLNKFVINQTATGIDRLNSITSLARFALFNATLTSGALILFPIFWFGKSIPTFDILMTLLFSLFVAFFLYKPVMNLRALWLIEKRKVVRNIKDEDEGKTNTNNVEQLLEAQYEVEELESLSMSLLLGRDKLRLLACIALITFSWLIFLGASLKDV